MQKTFTPVINYVSPDDGFPITKTFKPLFTNYQAAFNYAADRMVNYEGGTIKVLEGATFDTVAEADSDSKVNLINQARLKLTLDEINALGI